jgi:cbb3-type cytochrome oxidase subunit 3
MLRDIFQSIRGFEYFGVISMFIFVLFFILVILHTYSMRKKDIDEYSRIPFDDSTKDTKISKT